MCVHVYTHTNTLRDHRASVAAKEGGSPTTRGCRVETDESDPARPPTQDNCDFPGSGSRSLTFGKSCTLDLERKEEVRAKPVPRARNGPQGWTSGVTFR